MSEEKTEPSGRILIMDDEEIVRLALEHLVRMLGYEADFAEEGLMAYEKYRLALTSGSPYDLVILDLHVATGMGGYETFERLREIDEKVKAVVSSGDSEDRMVRNYEQYGFVGALVKPYEMETLREILDRLTGEKS